LNHRLHGRTITKPKPNKPNRPNLEIQIEIQISTPLTPADRPIADMASTASAVLLIIITLFCETTSRTMPEKISKQALLTQIPVPPVGVLFVAGCGADVLVNICLTLLGYVSTIPTHPPSPSPSRNPQLTRSTNRYIPGHIHAFYILYVYYSRADRPSPERAAGIYSDRVQTGGHGYPAGGYGAINNPPPAQGA